jgi:hypothetical protein
MGRLFIDTKTTSEHHDMVIRVDKNDGSVRETQVQRGCRSHREQRCRTRRLAYEFLDDGTSGAKLDRLLRN